MCSLRRTTRRRVVLFHHLRLDDVELAGSGLASGCTLVLYEGSPFRPTPTALIDLIDQESISLFGVGAKYVPDRKGRCRSENKPRPFLAARYFFHGIAANA
ncbi:MAG: hypothetical protein CM1200mP9_08060 [Gammaproteobacteria bacterium]|nr:MAG: hypothetical protein CM1200mP9_08060 [Gammaproteobacteria bacterium]